MTDTAQERIELARAGLAPIVEKFGGTIEEKELERAKKLAADHEAEKARTAHGPARSNAGTIPANRETRPHVTGTTPAISTDPGVTPASLEGRTGSLDVKSTTGIKGEQVVFKTGRICIDNNLEIQCTRYVGGRTQILLKGKTYANQSGTISHLINVHEIDDLIYALLRARRFTYPAAKEFKEK